MGGSRPVSCNTWISLNEPAIKEEPKVERRSCFIDFQSHHKMKERIIGKYLSCLRKLDSIIISKAGFETQLRASRLSISCGMGALSMIRQIRHGLLQRGREPRHVPILQGSNNVA